MCHIFRLGALALALAMAAGANAPGAWAQADAWLAPLPEDGTSGAEQAPQQQPLSEAECSSCETCDASCAFTWYVGGEVPLLKPRFSDGAEEDNLDNVFDFDLQSDTRLWLGLEYGEGAGLRGTWFQHDDRSSLLYNPGHAQLGGSARVLEVHLETVDVEATQQLVFGRYEMGLSGGVRYAQFDEFLVSLDSPDFRGKVFQGIGPTLELQLRQPWPCWDVSWLADVRGSLLVGSADWLSSTEGVQSTDDMSTVLEMQVGLEWRRCGPLGEWSLRAVFEQQNWLGAGAYFDQPSVGAPATYASRAVDHDVALMGFSFGAQWAR